MVHETHVFERAGGRCVAHVRVGCGAAVARRDAGPENPCVRGRAVAGADRRYAVVGDTLCILCAAVPGLCETLTGVIAVAARHWHAFLR